MAIGGQPNKNIKTSSGSTPKLFPHSSLAVCTRASAFTISSGGLTFVYDENDIGGLTVAGADGEDDNTGDYSVSYSAGGLSASYETDTTSEDTLINLGYAMGDLTLGLELSENDNAVGGYATATTSVGYVMGDATISLEADDADDWDASVAYFFFS